MHELSLQRVTDAVIAAVSMTLVLCTVIRARLSATSFAARTRGESLSASVMSVTSAAMRVGGTSAAHIAAVANRANPTITNVFRVIFSSRCNGPRVAMIPDKYCTGTLLLRQV